MENVRPIKNICRESSSAEIKTSLMHFSDCGCIESQSGGIITAKNSFLKIHVSQRLTQCCCINQTRNVFMCNSTTPNAKEKTKMPKKLARKQLQAIIFMLSISMLAVTVSFNGIPQTTAQEATILSVNGLHWNTTKLYTNTTSSHAQH